MRYVVVAAAVVSIIENVRAAPLVSPPAWPLSVALAGNVSIETTFFGVPIPSWFNGCPAGSTCPFKYWTTCDAAQPREAHTRYDTTELVYGRNAVEQSVVRSCQDTPPSMYGSFK